MIALDCEATGLDHKHGTRPFFVTICSDDGDQRFWEWPVNPLTRQPIIPESDVRDIKAELDVVRGWGDGFDEEIAERHKIVGQNFKYDAHALQTVGIIDHDFPWHMLHDTIIAGHLLASNRPHNLTDMAMQYLGVDIQPLEDDLGAACQEARRWCRTNLPEWAIAKEGRPDMPSVKSGGSGGKKGSEKDKAWKCDMWLPRAVAKQQEFPEPDHECDHSWQADHHCKLCGGHRWYLLLRDYANADSAVTIALWQVMRKEMERRNLTAMYRERMKAIPIAWGMEERGITLSSERLNGLRAEYAEESKRLGDLCMNVAATRGYGLEMPKNGRSKNLDAFVFDVLKMPVLATTDTGAPSMDKKVIEGWVGLLPATDKRRAFINALKNKRSRDTALSYLEGYERFWLPLVQGQCNLNHEPSESDEWRVLYPSLNPTGTDTLRWSSQSPNEQNISKKESFNLRRCFGPAPGREWWSLDAKNIELRIPAYESGERDLIELLERMDDPPYYGSEHLLNFSTVYPDVWEKELKAVGIEKVGPHCKKKYAATNYQWCKNGDFAIGYGCGRHMADSTFQRKGAYDLLKSRFRKKDELNRRQIAFAEKWGYVETIPDKTVDPDRGYPLLVSRSNRGDVIPTTPLNYHVSGTAMWWTMKAMIRVQKLLDAWRAEDGFDGHIALQAHDELVLDLPAGFPPRDKDDNRNGCNLRRVRSLQKVMERGGDDINIPTPCGVEFHGDNWSEGVTL